MTRSPVIHVVGGGLAGSEVAWQALNAGIRVVMHEMRPTTSTAAHQTDGLAELVCSNSLKSMSPDSAPGQLKQEMRALNSLVLQAAGKAQIPGGQALTVDRQIFSEFITQTLHNHPNFELRREKIVALPSAAEAAAEQALWVIATGPLTAPELANHLAEIAGGAQRLYFYDAIAPILDADSIDRSIAFRADRYDKGDGDGDYLNLPFTKEEYETFIDAVAAAEKMPLHAFEETKYFEACLPIEVMLERGRETLRFGPMKPVGLTDPRTGRWPYAAIQLRMENVEGTMYSMVGFQTKMKWPDQKRVFSLVPGLKNVEFLRYGSVHRNTYIKSPEVLAPDFSCRNAPHVFVAGQLTGVEGYSESSAIGILAGRAAVARMKGESFRLPPAQSVIGALGHYVTFGNKGEFQPMNANLGLLPPIPKQKNQSKAERKALQCRQAQAAFTEYLH